MITTETLRHGERNSMLVHDGITQSIIGAAIEVHRELAFSVPELALSEAEGCLRSE
jgi:hypothetical protein